MRFLFAGGAVAICLVLSPFGAKAQVGIEDDPPSEVTFTALYVRSDSGWIEHRGTATWSTELTSDLRPALAGEVTFPTLELTAIA